MKEYCVSVCFDMNFYKTAGLQCLTLISIDRQRMVLTQTILVYHQSVHKYH